VKAIGSKSSVLLVGVEVQDDLILGSKAFSSRLLTGTGKFSSPRFIPQILEASGSQMMTVAVRRVNPDKPEEDMLTHIPAGVTILPNTSGARTAQEAVRIARIAREMGCGDFIKIEVITDMKYLLPDGEETLAATAILAKEGFAVLPYIQPDPVLCRKLEEAGAAAVMPLAAPIGSLRGLRCRDMLEMIIEASRVPVIVDAGIGKSSHAAEAMEMGADAVLVNTAISAAQDPVLMSRAFALAVQAGRFGYLAKAGAERPVAVASSPLTGFLGATRAA